MYMVIYTGAVQDLEKGGPTPWTPLGPPLSTYVHYPFSITIVSYSSYKLATEPAIL